MTEGYDESAMQRERSLTATGSTAVPGQNPPLNFLLHCGRWLTSSISFRTQVGALGKAIGA